MTTPSRPSTEKKPTSNGTVVISDKSEQSWLLGTSGGQATLTIIIILLISAVVIAGVLYIRYKKKGNTNYGLYFENDFDEINVNRRVGSKIEMQSATSNGNGVSHDNEEEDDAIAQQFVNPLFGLDPEVDGEYQVRDADKSTDQDQNS